MVAMIKGQPGAIVDSNQVCNKTCQVAPTEQREMCMRMCTQFSDQNATKSVAPPVSMKGASAATPVPTNAKEKQHSELGDIESDASNSESSESHSEPVSTAANVIQVGSTVFAIALSAALL
ncbi:hypothetical protein COEREDRAFT_9495 [Coemansia reversa NRRL 1564]|uniref:Uncharacterized protein n=1 Tax=Coemansia reversa (strain ATCC 12441 / NRRL 1564) TaxID=763665 RepID=A0A2G5B8K7_COERN|nr:hypothetical protein COEREDRAFT_9495 [Coemansia reversa NRRL 1564]|eukprot:PIA15356.1 hypothetical protein COEREDRAFT_9495 [Coemansia reversa NRRL 1564]